MQALKLWILLLLSSSLCLSNTQQADRPYAVKQYIKKYRYLAVEINQKTAIPIPVILAVAGLESNWGKSELAIQANNHFGIKNKEEWTGLVYCKQTLEYYQWTPYEVRACFRKYPLIRASYEDFGNFVSTRPNYAHLKHVASWNYRSWADGLKIGGYATDPEYTDKLLRIIWRYQLYDYI